MGFDSVVDKGVVLTILWALLTPTTAFASDGSAMPIDKSFAEAPKAAPGPNQLTFAPLTGACKCVSTQVKTGILLVGIGAICYSAFCAKVLHALL